MKVLYTLLFAACTLGNTASACSWIPSSFCATNTSRPDDVVVSGRIVQEDADGIDLAVIHVFKGIETRDTIRIWDGTDFDCNGTFSMAASALGAVGDSIIVILPLITTIENTWDVLGDYRRPDYFGHITELRITNGNVLGFIIGSGSASVENAPYSAFVAHWNSGPDNCSTFLSVEAVDRTPPFTAQLLSTTLALTVRSDVAPGSTVHLLASNGQQVASTKGMAGTSHMDLAPLATGVYHIVLVQQDGTRTAARVLKP